MSAENKCTFCTLNDGPNAFSISREYGLPFPAEQAILLETDHFFVKPDVLPIEPDGRHVLIIPTVQVDGAHPFSFAALTRYADEVGTLITTLEQIYGGRLLLAEHGASREGGSVQSVYHAHTHAIYVDHGVEPLEFMVDVLKKRHIQPHHLNIHDPSHPVTLAREYTGQGYIYLQYGNDALIACGDDFPSQITQRAISGLLNAGEELNWKKMGVRGEKRPDLAKEALQRTMMLIERCKNHPGVL
jgi:hypothetical protein